MRLRVLVVPVVLPLVLCAGWGCGTTGTDSAQPSSPPTPASSPAPASPPEPQDSPPESLPTLEPPDKPPSAPTDVYERVVVRGTVVRSESGCVVVRSDVGTAWALLDVDPAPLAVGTQVTVSGRSRPETVTCEGIPLVVERLSTP